MTDFCDECSPEIECIRCESAGLVSGIPSVPMVLPMTERQQVSNLRMLDAIFDNTQMSERQEILSKLERVWDLNPDKSFGEVIEELAFAHSENRDESLIGGVEDSYLLERLDDIILEHLNEIIDEHENGECR